MKKVKNKNRKKMMGLAAAFGLVTLLAGTFAWVTYNDERINRVKTAVAGDTVLNENWDNPGEITPGMVAKKEVSVTNTGTAPVFVRVSYEEVLTHLVSLGVETATAAPWAAADAPDVPVDFVPSKVATDIGVGKDGYTAIPAAQVTGLPTNVTLWAKGSARKDPATNIVNTALDYAIAFAYDTTDPTKYKFQKVEGTVEVTGGNTDGTVAANWTYTVTAPKYFVYVGGYTTVGFDWAGTNVLLGQGPITRYGVAADYTALAGTPITPATTTDLIPVANGDIKGIQADKVALGKDALKIEYGVDMIDIAGALIGDKWVYNSEDGFFYWTSTLVGGATTEDLLKNLSYGTDGGDPYKNITYDLIVAMEAIQVTKEALTDAAGWGMNTAVPGSQTTKVYNQLVTAGGL
ncbi:hypothetical protein I6N95_03840 [Vagococcus sp. BWB3-3]|uniref:Uncharacterized protein n=1 Tax=Vagococcus allomyrinae TaxID=2794353 RepID=A0A940SQV8_9ENTE|nr:hypothetical protein [Vagococcus allomyrinae]MBP1040137.1 hypothetical protein [Vagococcus allomyrinae]